MKKNRAESTNQPSLWLEANRTAHRGEPTAGIQALRGRRRRFGAIDPNQSCEGWSRIRISLTPRPQKRPFAGGLSTQKTASRNQLLDLHEFIRICDRE